MDYKPITICGISILLSVLCICLIKQANNIIYESQNEVVLKELNELVKPLHEIFIHSADVTLKPFSCCLPNHKDCDRRPLPERIPMRFDWRTTGYVGPILNQMKYFVCWAYSISGVIETLAANRTGKFVRLSIQEIIDIYEYHITTADSKSVVDTICNYHKVSKYAITTEGDYPLTNKNESMQKEIDHGWWLHYYEVYINVTPPLMKQLIIGRGPLIARVNAYAWQFYIGGVIQYHCKREEAGITHSVQIVGYVEEEPINYYIIKNSWGADFGDKGYIKIAMDNFVCGVGNQIITLNVYNNL